MVSAYDFNVVALYLSMHEVGLFMEAFDNPNLWLGEWQWALKKPRLKNVNIILIQVSEFEGFSRRTQAIFKDLQSTCAK